MNKVTKVILGALLTFILSAFAGCSPQGSTVTLDAEEYAPGDIITASYNVVEEIDSDAWIGVIPASTPHGAEADSDEVDVAYEYLNNNPTGTVRFSAPEPGDWTIRVFDTDSLTGTELATASFTVTAAAEEEAEEEEAEEEESAEEESSLTLDAAEYVAGDTITVTYRLTGDLANDAWIGVVPASVAHGAEADSDTEDVDYEYIDSTSGTITFAAPEDAGDWTIRAFDSDKSGNELASANFTVTE